MKFWKGASYSKTGILSLQRMFRYQMVRQVMFGKVLRLEDITLLQNFCQLLMEQVRIIEILPVRL